jgi:hypothetical protein
VVLTCLLAACDYIPGRGAETPPDTSLPDGPCETFSSFTDTCELPVGDPLTLSGDLRFDTNTGDLFAGDAPVEVVTQTIATASGELKAILASTVVLTADTKLRAEVHAASRSSRAIRSSSTTAR